MHCGNPACIVDFQNRSTALGAEPGPKKFCETLSHPELCLNKMILPLIKKKNSHTFSHYKENWLHNHFTVEDASEYITQKFVNDFFK